MKLRDTQTCSYVWATSNTICDPAERAIAFIDVAHTGAVQQRLGLHAVLCVLAPTQISKDSEINRKRQRMYSNNCFFFQQTNKLSVKQGLFFVGENVPSRKNLMYINLINRPKKMPDNLAAWNFPNEKKEL